MSLDSEPFEEAASYLSTAPFLSKVSSSVKLELYGLFKYLTVSSNPNTSRPSIFDITGRAKWDAWSSAGKTFSSREAAQARYIEIARSLGWSEGCSVVYPEPKRIQRSEDDVWDDDDANGGGGGDGGFGASVSAMVLPEEEFDGSLHALALADDIPAIVSVLKERGVDIDSRDEYGYTALHLAADRGNLAAVQTLLERGADAGLKDPDDMTASELAKIAGHEHIVAAFSA